MHEKKPETTTKPERPMLLDFIASLPPYITIEEIHVDDIGRATPRGINNNSVAKMGNGGAIGFVTDWDAVNASPRSVKNLRAAYEASGENGVRMALALPLVEIYPSQGQRRREDPALFEVLVEARDGAGRWIVSDGDRTEAHPASSVMKRWPFVVPDMPLPVPATSEQIADIPKRPLLTADVPLPIVAIDGTISDEDTAALIAELQKGDPEAPIAGRWRSHIARLIEDAAAENEKIAAKIRAWQDVLARAIAPIGVPDPGVLTEGHLLNVFEAGEKRYRGALAQAGVEKARADAAEEKLVALENQLEQARAASTHAWDEARTEKERADQLAEAVERLTMEVAEAKAEISKLELRLANAIGDQAAALTLILVNAGVRLPDPPKPGAALPMPTVLGVLRSHFARMAAERAAIGDVCGGLYAFLRKLDAGDHGGAVEENKHLAGTAEKAGLPHDWALLDRIAGRRRNTVTAAGIHLPTLENAHLPALRKLHAHGFTANATGAACEAAIRWAIAWAEHIGGQNAPYRPSPDDRGEARARAVLALRAADMKQSASGIDAGILPTLEALRRILVERDPQRLDEETAAAADALCALRLAERGKPRYQRELDAEEREGRLRAVEAALEVDHRALGPLGDYIREKHPEIEAFHHIAEAALRIIREQDRKLAEVAELSDKVRNPLRDEADAHAVAHARDWKWRYLNVMQSYNAIALSFEAGRFTVDRYKPLRGALEAALKGAEIKPDKLLVGLDRAREALCLEANEARAREAAEPTPEDISAETDWIERDGDGRIATVTSVKCRKEKAPEIWSVTYTIRGEPGVWGDGAAGFLARWRPMAHEVRLAGRIADFDLLELLALAIGGGVDVRATITTEKDPGTIGRERARTKVRGPAWLERWHRRAKLIREIAMGSEMEASAGAAGEGES